ncbi:MAG TPA: PD-(D/E)XK nuclease family protein, partial [Dehalococcoidia bacterium]|nr:PD-(D/E)XK nuclease family protein [Dehalococcoidia bacterium]
FSAKRGELVAASRTLRFTSATALGAKEQTASAGEPWTRGRAGTHLGRAVHAALQSLPLAADDASIRNFALAQAVAEAIPEQADEVVDLVRRALQSQAAARARSAAQALREVPFVVPFDSIIIEGYIDLLIEGEEGLEIVDWKTDRLAEGEVNSRLAEYQLQAGLYVLGLEKVLGRAAQRVTYVFLDPQREERLEPIEDLRQAAREAISRHSLGQ